MKIPTLSILIVLTEMSRILSKVSLFFNNSLFNLLDDYWFGFGIGPRSCPATRWAFVAIKVFIANVIKNYEIIAGEGTPPIDKIELKFVGTQVKTSKPMNIRFKKRS